MAEMQFTIYDTATLVQVVRNLKRSQKFLLDNFFPNIIESDTEFVAIDVDVGKRRLAPFVSPLVEGKFVESLRIETNVFKPAYIKDKRAPDLRKPIRRMIGERIGGELSAEERMQANLARELEDQIDMIDRRLEWMAAQALLTGTVLIKGDGFDPKLVDFQRDPELTIALSGSAQWGKPGIIPTGMFEDWGSLVMQKSGAVCTDIVFTKNPWKLFLQDPVVKQANWYAVNQANNTRIGAEIQHGAVFKGVWGQYRLWLYNDWFVDPETEKEMPMLPDGAVLFTGPDLMGTRAFGAIIDPSFSYGALAYAPKMWIKQDPAQMLMMMQSAPIVIPSRVNASLSAIVC